MCCTASLRKCVHKLRQKKIILQHVVDMVTLKFLQLGCRSRPLKVRECLFLNLNAIILSAHWCRKLRGTKFPSGDWLQHLWMSVTYTHTHGETRQSISSVSYSLDWELLDFQNWGEKKNPLVLLLWLCNLEWRFQDKKMECTKVLHLGERSSPREAWVGWINNLAEHMAV